MKLALKMDMGNAAFGDEKGYEAARILEKLARQLKDHPLLYQGDTYKLVDENGNTVGEARITR